MERRRGRRDNGLDASDYAAVGDLDPRVGEHLLDLLGARGIAAYLQPSMDVNPVTRDTRVPARPVDRLYADRAHLGTARDYLRRLAAEEDATEQSGSGEPARGAGARRDPEPSGDAEPFGDAEPTRGAAPPDVPDLPGSAEAASDRPAARSHPDPGPGYVDATFEGIVARFDRPVEPSAASWPAAEEVDDERGSGPAEPAPAAPVPGGPADARRYTEPSLLDGLDTFGADLPDGPEDRFIPPPPPPLPRISRQAVLGTLAILAGLVLLLMPGGGPFGRGEATLFGFAALVGGAVALILRLRPDTDPDDEHPDDGARV